MKVLSSVLILFFCLSTVYSVSYVKFNIPFKTVNKIKNIIETSENVKLKDRGEAHITVFIPSETKELKRKGINFKEMQKKIDISKFSIEGIGFSKKANNTVYYIVIRSKDLQKIRDDLNYSKKDFHITIGFIKHDMYDVRKNIVNEKLTEISKYYLTILKVKLEDNIIEKEIIPDKSNCDSDCNSCGFGCGN